jgi:hypothetical protein
MRRLFVAAGANPKPWAGLFRERLFDRETLVEMAEDGLPLVEQGPAGARLSPALPERTAVDR